MEEASVHRKYAKQNIRMKLKQKIGFLVAVNIFSIYSSIVSACRHQIQIILIQHMIYRGPSIILQYMVIIISLIRPTLDIFYS